MAPKPLTERQRQLIQNYSYCRLQMTPQQFRNKWELTYEEISLICDRSPGTVNSWFSSQKKNRPTRDDLRHLALINFLLENYESISEDIINLLCPPYSD
ncbi:MAG: helix-turn-helix domain-containing protein [Cyanobacteriota bacterium]